MHNKIIFSILCFAAFSLNGMSSSSKSHSSRSKSKKMLQALEKHPFNNLAHIFTVTDAFEDHKQKTYQKIAYLIAGHVKKAIYTHSNAFSSDSKYLKTITGYQQIGIIDINSGKIIIKIQLIDTIKSAEFSPDSRYLALGLSQSARIIDLKSRKTIFELNAQKPIIGAPKNTSSSINSVAFSPDNNYLATGSADGYACIFDIKSAICIHTINHSMPISQISFSPDGRNLITNSFTDIYIFNPSKTDRLTHILSLAQSNLIEALATAAQDTISLPKNKRARIHANDTHWSTWLSLKKILPEKAIKKLEPYIVDSTTDGYETPHE